MVSVSDGELTTTKSWNVTVGNVNREPYDVKIVSPKAGEAYREGAAITFEGQAQDPDGDLLELTWYEGAKELGKGHNLTLELAPGAHAVVLHVSDGTVTVKTAPLSFTVKANALPQLFSLDPSNGQKFDKGFKIRFRAEAGDTDGDTLSYCWTENGIPLSSTATFYKSDFAPGTHLIRLTISDGKASTETTLTILVNKPAASGPGGGSSSRKTMSRR
jgi:hypothetical protein